MIVLLQALKINSIVVLHGNMILIRTQHIPLVVERTEATSEDVETVAVVGLELFDEAISPAKTLSSPIRLIGFGVTNIQGTPDVGTPSLFEDPAADKRKKRERLSKAMDELRERGMGFVTRSP